MKSAPEPKDVLEFQFKESSTSKISNGFTSVPASCSLVVVDGKRGLLYTSCENQIIVLKSGDNADKHWRKEYVLPANITRLALNCDCSFLAVTFHHPTAYIYNAVISMEPNLQLLREIKLSSAENVYVMDLRWNPCIPGMLCTITSDHTIGRFNITVDENSSVLTVLEQLEKLEVLCVAWSPKGKQLVVGCKDGSLLQLKPDLKKARNITGPNPSIGSVIALLWISSYQFCAAYSDPQESRIKVLIIDAPKGEANAIFTCYEDITYGSFEGGDPRYYFEHVPEWGLIVAASSGSSEVAVLGSRDNGTNWEHWQLVDSGRAQLPLIRTSESYPVGLAVDRTSVEKLPWGGEGSTLPHPVPMLHILGTLGQLCSFHMVNLMPGIPAVCSPPIEIVPPISQPRHSIGASEISFNLIGGTTSTPRPKQINAIPDRSKIPSTTISFGDSLKVGAPQPQVEFSMPKPQIEKIEIPAKPETTVAVSKDLKQQEKVGIDSSICIKAFQEESSFFEEELKSRRELPLVDIGTPAERTELIEKTEKMEKFLMDLQEATASLTSDIVYLKALVLQTFAWLEETKSKCVSGTSNNTHIHSENSKLKELRNLLYYTQTQLDQATRILDDEWFEHINKEKRRMKLSSLEFVYQNMVRHWDIIAAQKSMIQKQIKKWKNLTRGNTNASLNKSMASMALTSPINPSINSTSSAIEQRCKRIANQSISFSKEKQSKLRNLLKHSTIRSIKAATPSPIQERLEATLSSLATVSPPKQVHQPKAKSKSVAKPEQAVVNTASPFQPVKSPLASLDRIVANIGGSDIVQPVNAQNNPPPAPLATSPIIKIPQVDSKSRIATALSAAQTSSMGPPKSTKPITVSSLSTPHAPHKALPEVSPFSSNTSKTYLPTSLPPPLIQTPGSASSVPKEFSKIEPILFSSPVKVDATLLSGTSSGITSPAVATVTPSPSVPSLQVAPQTSFSFSSPVQLPSSHPPNYPTMTKPSSTAVSTPTISTSPTTPSLQSFSFASKPTGTAAFSFASKPVTSLPSGSAQSLDLSAMGLNLNSSNVLPQNSATATSGANNSLFGSLGSSPSGSIFSNASITSKDQIPGSIFGGISGSPIYAGPASNNGSSFGGETVPSAKPSIFGSGATNSLGSIFGGSPQSSSASVVSSLPAATSSSSVFANSATSVQSSVFGNISSVSNTSSPFREKPSSLSSVAPLGGALASSGPLFGETQSLIKPPTFSGDSAASTTTSVFGRSSDPKPSAFGGISASASPLPVFRSGTAGSASPSIFGGSISSTPNTSIFGGIPSNPPTASVFGTVQPTSPNQSIFGGSASSPTSGPNLAVATPTSTVNVPAFGQAATFGAKPEFGSMFGASKPIFGGGFGNASFPVSPQTASGFSGFSSSPPLEGGQMGKVFGESSGSSTFENLAAQDGGLTFGNLAQKQAEPAPPPAFSGKSSFQSWR
ncbi:nuclear pore complex protein Nup214 [Athalia rosae]|uniref:nuclear pore complex protein Nup214 n=1 Tax=Athalia rosae TaxID=37344 RepID=UPI0020339625|nr:nuclear pore complex protein Nup214 [Athalia rosae]